MLQFICSGSPVPYYLLTRRQFECQIDNKFACDAWENPFREQTYNSVWQIISNESSTLTALSHAAFTFHLKLKYTGGSNRRQLLLVLPCHIFLGGSCQLRGSRFIENNVNYLWCVKEKFASFVFVFSFFGECKCQKEKARWGCSFIVRFVFLIFHWYPDSVSFISNAC